MTEMMDEKKLNQPEHKGEENQPNWTFLTNHAHVLVCLSKEHHDTLREVAQCVGITERAVQRIVADLESAGIITRSRDGRRNTYKVDPSAALRHDLESHKTVGDLMEMVLKCDN
jgi:DNA-binding MarR family transcriptional regulator